MTHGIDDIQVKEEEEEEEEQEDGQEERVRLVL